ncbi:hypothetical protein PC116_g5369 [Phytophthora cactorum]|uniref:Uncharacterized protein n=1 Tax=Phytophthora cactorum TaxID=29920 RepID=A0A8T1AGE8_9STRA|nr:hypothetical protein PC117_g26983 [Phytophthora cactorum]KAG2961346.1 hypothetical protein PC119_g26131 [Phytophthora cactorum]KAG2973728.1 hypothetical protein PC120_g26104 [Phytophthora cactorum]KAG4246856.1 hypothetical protein PC116_g5369 [Phytophthora cactorum]
MRWPELELSNRRWYEARSSAPPSPALSTKDSLQPHHYVVHQVQEKAILSLTGRMHSSASPLPRRVAYALATHIAAASSA